MQVWFLAQYSQPSEAEHARLAAVRPEASGQHSSQMSVYFALSDPSFHPATFGTPTCTPAAGAAPPGMHGSFMDPASDAEMAVKDSSAPGQAMLATGTTRLTCVSNV